ncbi:Mitochondrial ribonuclease P catalytic subunit [Taenia solium]|eukprot:TsM_000304200 transcript=TsM_000304200 gene=TsM_000304200
MAGVLRSFRGFMKSFYICGVSKGICLRYTHFSAVEAMSSFQNIDAYFKRLDNSFLESSRLQAMYELLENPSIDPYFKMNFWSKFISTSLACGKDKVVNSVILFVLGRSHCHSIATLITVLKAFALQKRFQEFESLYALIRLRLSPTDTVAYAADLSAALCFTPFYKEAKDFLYTSFVKKAPVGSFVHFLSAAATYGPLDEAISFIYELHPMGLKPTHDFYLAFIKRLKGDEGKKLMVSLLEAVNNCQCVIPNSTAILLKDWFEKHGWRGTMGVTLSGISCNSCLKHLKKLHFDNATCSQLAERFYDSVLKGRNADELLLTTTPNELDSFHAFLKITNSPFDCVIDLPNYLYTVSNRKLPILSVEEQTNLLSDLISSLHRVYHFNRICLVGKERGIVKKKYFWGVVKALGNQTGVKVQTFLTDHKSNDDAFMIYLALWSGPNCYLFSNDEFRQHRFTLGPDASPLLARWQAARQISLRSAHPLTFLGPVLCDAIIQGNMTEGWHVPYESGDQRLSYLPPNTWLCLRP